MGFLVIRWVLSKAGIARERNIFVHNLFKLVKPPIAFRLLHTENLIYWDREKSALGFLKLCKAINERIAVKTEAGTSPVPPIGLQQVNWERKNQAHNLSFWQWYGQYRNNDGKRRLLPEPKTRLRWLTQD